MEALGSKWYVCVDDYGISPSVDRCIEKLCRQGSISAVSAMVTFPEIEPDKLLQQVPHLDIGLHLNLTSEKTQALKVRRQSSGFTDNQGHFEDPTTLFFNAAFGRVSHSDLMLEIEAQIDRFESLFKKQPSHIDGHQNVHQWPLIRRALIDVLKKRQYGGWVRNTARVQCQRRDLGKKILWEATGRTMERSLQKAEFKTNDSIAVGPQENKELVQVGSVEPIHLWIFHPGADDELSRLRDPAGAGRDRDARFLAGLTMSQHHDTAERSP